MKNHRILYLIVCGVILLALVIAALPLAAVKAQVSSLTITPVADAFVYSSSAHTNYGTGTSIRIDGSPTMRSYLRFDVKGLNGASILSAKLQVYANSSNDAGYTVKAVRNNSWSEKTLNYSNAPALGSEIKSIGKFAKDKYTDIDVSSYIHGEGTFSFALVARNSIQTNLASREDKSHAPKLVLKLSAAGQPPSSTTVPT